MKIEKLSEGHIPGLLPIILQYKKETASKVPEDCEERLTAVCRKILARDDYYMYVAVEGKRVVGFINAHHCLFPLLFSSEMYVSDLVVDEKSRGLGAGGRLLEAIEKKAREFGCIRLMLNNQKTIESYKREFYKKHGFEERVHMANFIKAL
ncbi:MAG: GNAT family N-acetyltransferase [Spirochaetales bacterium]|nr:GNAT family N-acetyltransferase [Spirochaetales bacterium]